MATVGFDGEGLGLESYRVVLESGIRKLMVTPVRKENASLIWILDGWREQILFVITFVNGWMCVIVFFRAYKFRHTYNSALAPVCKCG